MWALGEVQRGSIFWALLGQRHSLEFFPKAVGSHVSILIKNVTFHFGLKNISGCHRGMNQRRPEWVRRRADSPRALQHYSLVAAGVVAVGWTEWGVAGYPGGRITKVYQLNVRNWVGIGELEMQFIEKRRDMYELSWALSVLGCPNRGY